MDLAVVKASEILILKMKTRDLGWLGTTQLDALHGCHRSRRKHIAHSLQTYGSGVREPNVYKIVFWQELVPMCEEGYRGPGTLGENLWAGKGRERERDSPFCLQQVGQKTAAKGRDMCFVVCDFQKIRGTVFWGLYINIRIQPSPTT